MDKGNEDGFSGRRTKLENEKQQLSEQLLLLYQHLHEKDVKMAQLQVEKDCLERELSKERNLKAECMSQQASEIVRLQLELTRVQPLLTHDPAEEEIASCAATSTRETARTRNERKTPDLGKLLFVQNLLAYLRGLRADGEQLKFDVREKFAELNSGLTDALAELLFVDKVRKDTVQYQNGRCQRMLRKEMKKCKSDLILIRNKVTEEMVNQKADIKTLHITILRVVKVAVEKEFFMTQLKRQLTYNMKKVEKGQMITNTNPAYPMENGESPFLNAPNDVIDVIFRTIAANGAKPKMLIELVCGKFRFRINQRSAWKGENKLELGQYEQYILINGQKFKFETAPLALSKLLERTQVENFVMFDRVVLSHVRLSLCHAMNRNKKYIKLKRIQLLSTFDYDGSMMCVIAGCGLENVKIIECGDWKLNRFVNNFPFAFYSMLSQCHQLDTFILRTNEISLIWNYLLAALENCKQISKLIIDDTSDRISQQNAVELGLTCARKFHNMTMLWLQAVVEIFVPQEFLNAIGEQVRANIRSFSIKLDSRIHSHRQAMTTMCKYFPNLQMLNVEMVYGRFHNEIILGTVGNIFQCYGGRDGAAYKFELRVDVRNAGTVLHRLAMKKWQENDDWVQMQTKTGKWSCTKDNVVIMLTFNNG